MWRIVYCPLFPRNPLTCPDAGRTIIEKEQVNQGTLVYKKVAAFSAPAPYAARMVIQRQSWDDLAPDKRQIVEWRFCQFKTFVRSVDLAEQLALAEIDYHEVQEMVEAGCSEELLERILT